MKADVAAAFVVVKAELALELFVVELDHPAQPRQPRELLGFGVSREVADPVVDGMLVTFGPFDDQPFLARLLAIACQSGAQRSRARTRTARRADRRSMSRNATVLERL